MRVPLWSRGRIAFACVASSVMGRDVLTHGPVKSRTGAQEVQHLREEPSRCPAWNLPNTSLLARRRRNRPDPT